MPGKMIHVSQTLSQCGTLIADLNVIFWIAKISFNEIDIIGNATFGGIEGAYKFR